MRALIAALALFAVPCAWAEDPSPTPTPTEAVDEREAALREIEYRSGKFFEGREKMRASIPGLAADLRPMACKAANATTRARALVDEMERDPGIDCTKI